MRATGQQLFGDHCMHEEMDERVARGQGAGWMEVRNEEAPESRVRTLESPESHVIVPTQPHLHRLCALSASHRLTLLLLLTTLPLHLALETHNRRLMTPKRAPSMLDPLCAKRFRLCASSHDPECSGQQ